MLLSQGEGYWHIRRISHFGEKDMREYFRFIFQNPKVNPACSSCSLFHPRLLLGQGARYVERHTLQLSWRRAEALRLSVQRGHPLGDGSLGEAYGYTVWNGIHVTAK